ncbi:class I SAM-dependent methyltransferase [Pedobacter sp. MR22-3]|uniref:class I SAM-dependent methyltransferase n=1 Tax=Pedobacter sp. MR22-3 TaxID=2994552 RepID=UPI00224816D0|nr:class I SAM-dependent methyltransferase [Pedobacter sp. MR22-3]MCX2584102.1 class I SAM-dependent methyltransferase [Pedobacter sp. MR22-3]
MNDQLLTKAVQEYINANLHADVNKIALAKSKFPGVSSAELAGQILSKKKSEKKLPSWFHTSGIYYPPALSIEQTSSEITASYKSKLAAGRSLIDLTGGFGVDAHYFAKQLDTVTHCEINTELSGIAAYNSRVLKSDNIHFKPVNGIAYLTETTKQYDTIYVDPARRAGSGKVFMLKDCTPDVNTHLDLLLQKSQRLMIKTAPLLDITAGLNELKQVSEIHIVSIKNECKELLWIIDHEFKGEPTIFSVSLNEKEKVFSFKKSESHVNPQYADEISDFKYLYEPDAALLKSGAFNLIGQTYNLTKLHPQTQLYVGHSVNHLFPGRIFEIQSILAAAELKKATDLTGNIIVRNYPAEPENLAKKYKIKPDHDQFLIFTKTAKEAYLIIKSKIIQHY